MAKTKTLMLRFVGLAWGLPDVLSYLGLCHEGIAQQQFFSLCVPPLICSSWKKTCIAADWSCRWTTWSNTSSRWFSSLHCRIRSTSTCRSRLTARSAMLILNRAQHTKLAHLFARCTTYEMHTSPHTHSHCVPCCRKTIVFQCVFCCRMVNILLPAHSRHKVMLSAAGLASEADDLENHELEHLVLRERGVVWADQEAEEQCRKEDGTGVRPCQANKTAASTTSGELAPMLAFSHLLYHQNSPCSESPPPLIVIPIKYRWLMYYLGV